MTIYPLLEDVLTMHQELIEQFGGSLGIRDQGGIESALAQPQAGYYQDIIAEAAALWESLSQNHPFVDGNKRAAITVAASFLAVNGYRLQFEDMEAYEFLIGLYESGGMRFSELDAWADT